MWLFILRTIITCAPWPELGGLLTSAPWVSMWSIHSFRLRITCAPWPELGTQGRAFYRWSTDTQIWYLTHSHTNTWKCSPTFAIRISIKLRTISEHHGCFVILHITINEKVSYSPGNNIRKDSLRFDRYKRLLISVIRNGVISSINIGCYTCWTLQNNLSMSPTRPYETVAWSQVLTLDAIWHYSIGNKNKSVGYMEALYRMHEPFNRICDNTLLNVENYSL